MAAVVPSPARSRTRANPPSVLAAIVAGVSVEEIAKTHKLSAKRVESLLRGELQRRWVAPAQEHARLQIARLEAIATQLKVKAAKGDLPTIDRLLRVLDRLDRYHGYANLTSAAGSGDIEALRGNLRTRFEHAASAPPDRGA